MKKKYRYHHRKSWKHRHPKRRHIKKIKKRKKHRMMKKRRQQIHKINQRFNKDAKRRDEMTKQVMENIKNDPRERNLDSLINLRKW